MQLYKVCLSGSLGWPRDGVAGFGKEDLQLWSSVHISQHMSTPHLSARTFTHTLSLANILDTQAQEAVTYTPDQQHKCAERHCNIHAVHHFASKKSQRCKWRQGPFAGITFLKTPHHTCCDWTPLIHVVWPPEDARHTHTHTQDYLHSGCCTPPTQHQEAWPVSIPFNMKSTAPRSD